MTTQARQERGSDAAPKDAANDAMGSAQDAPGLCGGGGFETQFEARSPAARSQPGKEAPARPKGGDKAETERRRLLRLSGRMKTYGKQLGKVPSRAQRAIDLRSPQQLQKAYDHVQDLIGKWEASDAEFQALANKSATTLAESDPGFDTHRQKLEDLIDPRAALERQGELGTALYRTCLTLTLQDYQGNAIRGFTAPPSGDARAAYSRYFDAAIEVLYEASHIETRIRKGLKLLPVDPRFFVELAGIQKIVDRNEGKGAVFLRAVIEASDLSRAAKGALKDGLQADRQEANAEDAGIPAKRLTAIEGASKTIITILKQAFVDEKDRGRLDGLVATFEGAERQHLFMLLSDAGYYNMLFIRGNQAELDEARQNAGHFEQTGGDVMIQKGKPGADGYLEQAGSVNDGESMREHQLEYGQGGGMDGAAAAAGQIFEDIGFNILPATLRVLAGVMNGLSDLPFVGPLYGAGGKEVDKLAGFLDKELGNHDRFGGDVLKWRDAVGSATGELVSDIMTFGLPDKLPISDVGQNALQQFEDAKGALLAFKVGAGIATDVSNEVMAWVADSADPKAERKALGNLFEKVGHRAVDGLLEVALKETPGGAIAADLKRDVGDRKRNAEREALRDKGYFEENRKMAGEVGRLSGAGSAGEVRHLEDSIGQRAAKLRSISEATRSEVDAQFAEEEAQVQALISDLLSVRDPKIALARAAAAGIKYAVTHVARVIRDEWRPIVPADFVRGMGKFGYAAITQAAMSLMETLADKLGQAGSAGALAKFAGKVALASAELNWGDQLQAAIGDQIQPIFDTLADVLNDVISRSGLDQHGLIETRPTEKSAGDADAALEGAGTSAGEEAGKAYGGALTK